jgi:hypothetical protein
MVKDILALLRSNQMDADRFIQAVAINGGVKSLHLPIKSCNSLAMREAVLKTSFGTKGLDRS